MINPQWLEQRISRINFHEPKDVRAFEVLLCFAATEEIARKLKYNFIISPNNPMVNYFCIPQEHVMDIEIENMMKVSDSN